MKVLLRTKSTYISNNDKTTIINNIKGNVNENKIQKLYEFRWQGDDNFELTTDIWRHPALHNNFVLSIKCTIEESIPWSILHVQMKVKPWKELLKNLVFVFLMCIWAVWYSSSKDAYIFDLWFMYLLSLTILIYLPLLIGFNMEVSALRNTLEKTILSNLILKD